MNNFIARFCSKCSIVPLRKHISRNVLPIPTFNQIQKRHQTSPSLCDLSNLIDCPANEDFKESPYLNIDFEAITEGNPEKLTSLKVLQLEVDLLRQQGEQVPLCISTNIWKILLLCPSTQKRLELLRRSRLLEIKIEHSKKKELERKRSYAEFKAKEQASRITETTSSPVQYRLTDTSLFHRIRDHTMFKLYNFHLHLAEWFGPKIIVDCGYEAFMNSQASKLAAKQMIQMWLENREHSSPYDIIFCNVNENGALWQQFSKRFSSKAEVDCPLHFTSENYLNLFPKKNLVFLSTESKKVLYTYSHDDVYIIGNHLYIQDINCFNGQSNNDIFAGAYVDKYKSHQVPLIKAKHDGLRVKRLPVNRYVKLRVNSKLPTINQVRRNIDLK